MSVSTSETINQLLSEAGVFGSLFDAARIVDAKSGRVVECSNNEVRDTGITCVDVFGTSERCKNCTSIRALYTNEQVVKLEYVDGSVLLVVSVPLRYEGTPIVVELVKNITNSMTVDIKDVYRKDEVSGIIDKLNRLSTTDKLTGLMNRRFIDEKLTPLVQSSRLIGRPLSVALLDIDYFKKVNDMYSHQGGDAALSALAKVLLGFVRRESDFVARYGGEEFLCCFPGTSLATCRDISERIRERVEASSVDFQGTPIKLTVSIGVAESGELADLSQETLLALADKRLYEAKAAGRNRVV